MDGFDTLGLDDGTYEIVPSAEAVELSGSLGGMLSMAGRSEVPLHDIRDETGERVLEVVQRTLDEPDGVRVRSSPPDILFKLPDGDAVLAIEIDGPIAAYTFRDLTTRDTVATARRSLSIIGKWQLSDAAGEHRATVGRSRSLRNLLSRSHYGSYVLRTAGGTEAARFEHRRAEVESGSGDSLSRFEVAVDSSPLPPDAVVAFAYAVFRQARSSGDSSGHTGGGGE